MDIAKLEQYGLLQVTGEDARAFLHAQLTNDVENLAPGTARYAGWCSAKGRLMATFLVVPAGGGYLLQLSRDLAPAIARRLAMFVLRSKVKIADATGQWPQWGFWQGTPEGLPAPAQDLGVSEANGEIAVRVEAGRCLVFSPREFTATARADTWMLAEIRAGRPLIAQSTQDQFVPQMVNLERSGGVDFRKGCYPGQEIVARAQYRGAVKRRMYRLRGGPLSPGQELFSDDSPGQPSGTVVNAAEGEALAVLQVSSMEAGSAIRAQPQGTVLEPLALPYAQ